MYFFFFYRSSNFKTKATALLTRTFHHTVSLRATSNYIKLLVQPTKRGHLTRNLRCTFWQTTLAKSVSHLTRTEDGVLP
jgi:hypothetical protein